MLYLASFLALIAGFIHSVFGERFILIRLYREYNLPHLFGSDWFTKRVLRFGWHLTSLSWWGFAGILYFTANQSTNFKTDVLLVVGIVFLTSGIMSLAFTKGKHLSWIVFWLIAGICFYRST